ncbi:MAG TPA: hypothetical protein VNZ86_13825 [Bacteroidia bacterium]|jgi:hypothetical protein|nr:hypothetical protein [Bacteroidia bacterium]
MMFRAFARTIVVTCILAVVSCTMLKPHHVLTAQGKPLDFVMNKMDTACFSRAELNQLRGNKDYVTIAFDEMILDSSSHCMGLYRYALADKPAWPGPYGIKCYVLKFKTEIVIADQTVDRISVLDKFFGAYGKLFTPAQQEKIRQEFMSDCVLIQGQ